MLKDDWVYAGHMFDMGLKALSFTKGLTKTEYDQDEPLRLALTHIIQVLGEAARHISPAFQEAHSEIPWHEILGMRNRIVHDYMSVDEDIVWEVVQQDLPSLVAALGKILPHKDD
jgi:uncharacterized protein with HEPN domain